jgi:hypothetical protein
MRGVLRLLIALGLLAPVMLWARPAAAETWPQRPVKFLLPLGAGSGVDIGARLLADRLSTRWGQPVVVENRPGGDALVAISAFVSAHDDHVLLATPTSSFTAHPISTTICPTSRAISWRSPESPIRLSRWRCHVPECRIARGPRRAGTRATGEAELGGSDRCARFSVRRISSSTPV